MALSYVLYTNQTGTGPFNFTFPYISTAHIKVEKNGTVLTLNTHYTLSTSPTPQITLTSALVATDTLRIYRETPGRSAAPNNQPLVDFTDGSVLTAADLDKNTQQLLYLVQESDDTGSGALAATLDGLNWDAESKQIKSVAAPTANTDAVNKQYVDTLALYGVNQTSGQAWDLVGDGTDQYILNNPTPSAADPELFIVEVGGVLQHPVTNYTITQGSGNFYLQFTAVVAASTSIRVRNLGVSRGTINGSTITVDGGTLSVDMANNRVGVNTQTPQSNLNVHSSTNTSYLQMTNSTTGNATATDGLIVGNQGNAAYVWNYENSVLALATNNTARVYILGDGKVGMGTINPAYNLDIHTPSAAQSVLRLTNTATGTAGTDGLKLYVDSDGAAQVWNEEATSLRFATSGTERMRIQAGGSVGIGTAAPQQRLHVHDSGSTSTRINVTNSATTASNNRGMSFESASASGYVWNYENGPMLFGTNNTTRVTIGNDGLVTLAAGQLKFPSTANLTTDANTLDDYSEGSWTPQFIFYSRNGATPENVWRPLNCTYSISSGRYVKIGSLVHLSFDIATEGPVTAPAGTPTATWYLAIGNLPYKPTLQGSGCLNIGSAQSFLTLWPSTGFVHPGQTGVAAANSENGFIYLTQQTTNADTLYLSVNNTLKTAAAGASANRIIATTSYRTVQ